MNAAGFPPYLSMTIVQRVVDAGEVKVAGLMALILLIIPRGRGRVI
jgi:hypothetical protein